MKIGPNSVVSIDYTLTDPEGELLDSSADEGPLTYLHGVGEIVPGLENALAGRGAGESFKIVVSPEDGYGTRSEQNQVRVPRGELPDDVEPEEGMEFEATGPDGEVMHFWVEGVDGDDVLLSLDHPLAGVTLHFDVTVRDVREATSDELEHGHAHGPGTSGHH